MSLSFDGWRRVYQLTGGVIRPGGLALTDRALACCSLQSGARVLDVGCGAGATVEYLGRQGLVVAGVDASAQFFRSGCQRNGELLLTQARGERLPLSGGIMDAVLAECSLSVMEQVDQALAEFFRVLKPGGKLVISDLYFRRAEGAFDLRRLPLTGCLAGARSREELAAHLDARGFRTLLWEDHSVALRQLAAQLIMAGSSVERFWCETSCAGVRLDPQELNRAISAAKPGYFLLIAEC